MTRAALIEALRRIHWTLVAHLRASMERATLEELSRPVAETAGDVLYELDRRVEAPLVDALERELAGLGSFLVVAEGLGETERLRVPAAAGWDGDPDGVLIIDPVDGTRGLMYAKRSAWVLTGYAPRTVGAATLEDIEVAVQTEIPTLRSDLADQLWAVRGGGVSAVTRRLASGCETAFVPRPSRAADLRGGFAGIARFFPPARDVLARIDDELMERVLGPAPGRAQVFEDQYLSTGGQLHQLATGRDRFIADLRAPLFSWRVERGLSRGHDCHPYDLCTALIAREAGAVVTAAGGGPLDYPLDTTSPVSWAGYANDEIRRGVEPHLHAVLREILGPRHLHPPHRPV